MKRIGMLLICSALVLLFSSCVQSQQTSKSEIETKEEPMSSPVSSLKITTLSTMLANRGIGEWGFSALVEVDGHKILFDTGRFPETVLKNAETLGIDLSDVEDLFLSHNHGDHTGGVITLRNALKRLNPNALKKVHVGKGIFAQRLNMPNRMLEIKDQLESDGVEIIEYDDQYEIFKGVWITGPIDRIHDEKNWGGSGRIATPEGTVEDNIPEDQSLVIATKNGFVLLSGCGHAGIINTLEHINSKIGESKIDAVIGGFHLVNATDDHLKWTADKLSEFGITKIIGSHCTGINALYTLKSLMNLDRSSAVVGSVGDSFDLENGISPTTIAH